MTDRNYEYRKLTRIEYIMGPDCFKEGCRGRMVKRYDSPYGSRFECQWCKSIIYAEGIKEEDDFLRPM